MASSSLIPNEIMDAPTQRVYLTTISILIQSYKLQQFFTSSSSDSHRLLLQWSIIDVILVIVVRRIKVPRLTPNRFATVLIISMLCAIDWILFGAWKITIPSLPVILPMLMPYISTTERHVARLSSAFEPSHLIGQHTVHILDASSVELNPQSTPYCFSSNSQTLYIPLLFNNTTPSKIIYSISESASNKTLTMSISAHDLVSPVAKKVERVLEDWESLILASTSSHPQKDSQVTSRSPTTSKTNSKLTEKLFYLPIKRTGTIRLDKVIDKDGVIVSIIRRHRDLRVVNCPSISFSTPTTDVCLTSPTTQLVPLDLIVRGVEPISIKWHSVYSAIGSNKRVRKDETLAGITTGEVGYTHIPITASISSTGSYAYYLDSIVDGEGNIISYSSPLSNTTVAHSINVHSPIKISFSGGCLGGQPMKLFEGRTVGLEFKVTRDESMKSSLRSTVELDYKPATPDTLGWRKEIEIIGSSGRVEVDRSGVYEIVSARDEFCAGVVLVPNDCSVVDVPRPTLRASFEPLEDSCSSSTGSIATLTFTGTPPFILYYTIARLSGRNRQSYQQRFNHNTGQLRLEPEGSGEWKYELSRFNDANYENISLNIAQVQLVQGRAGGKFSKREVTSCEGSPLAIGVELSGTPPFDLTYTIIGDPPVVIHGISSLNYTIDLGVSPKLGRFSISLESVTDATGCARRLSVPDVIVDIHPKPKARFYSIDGSTSSTIRDIDQAKLPLRLTGEAPFVISYQPPSASRIIEVVAQQSNVELNLPPPISPGVHTLVSIRDRYCTGEIEQAEWRIDVLPRPRLMIAAGSGRGKDKLIREGVCAGTSDSFELSLQGTAPFKIIYELTTPSSRTTRTYQSIESSSTFSLDTSEPGAHSYKFLSVADLIYPDPSTALTPSPHRIEQLVDPLPSASFQRENKESYCANEQLKVKLHFVGSPPFEVVLRVKEDGRTIAESYVVSEIQKQDYTAKVPITLKPLSTYKVSIIRVSDRRCASTVVAEQDMATQEIKVEEVATIRRASSSDYCVGDLIHYDIKGPLGITLTTQFTSGNRRREQHAVDVSSRTFSRLATLPGKFEILSISSATCSSSAAAIDSVSIIHPLPGAKVSKGYTIVENIRGDQEAEIRFDLEGVPPFVLSFERRHGAMVESHTVSGIMAHSYSIFTAEEGTWRATYIADAYCSTYH